MTSVYVAGAYAQRKRALTAMKWIKGHPDLTLAHDWVKLIDEATGGDQSKEMELPAEVRAAAAHGDLGRALEADVFWFLVPPVGGRGCWFEAGFVKARAAEVNGPYTMIASGPHTDVSIFTELLDYKFVDDVEAFDFIHQRGWLC